MPIIGQNLQPFVCMVTSTYESNILEEDKKTPKQTTPPQILVHHSCSIRELDCYTFQIYSASIMMTNNNLNLYVKKKTRPAPFRRRGGG